jgi:hypothetical protein
MNSKYNAGNGSSGMTPLMAMPNGQVIFWRQPDSRTADDDQVPFQTLVSKIPGVTWATTVLLAAMAPVTMFVKRLTTY